MKQRLSAAILAGGKGTRLIAHKGLLEIEGVSIIKRQLEILRPIFDKILIVTNSPQVYKDLDAALVSDIVLGKGPLGGIYSALKHSYTLCNFIVASDMPCLNSALIEYMRSKISGYDAVVPEAGGRLEPLHAFYAKTCLSAIENQLKNNHLKITDFLAQLKIKKVNAEEISRFDPQHLSFLNINTPKDYEKVKQQM